MSAMLERLERVEQEVSRLSERLALLEGLAEATVAKPQLPRSVPPVPRPTALPPPRALPAARPAVRALDLEELLGGRLFALAGGAAVLVGVGFFVLLAVERGWIGETLRTLLAFAGSSALLAAGVWLHERRGGTQASLAAVGAGIAALYLTLTAATTLYDLIPDGLGLAAAFAVGAVATGIAVRWNSRTVAGVGIGGALVAPVLVEAGSGAAVAFLAVALAAAGAVLVWRRWEWLAVGAFAITMPQIALWSLFDEPSAWQLVPGLALFAALNLAVALGYELRVRSDRLRPSTSLLVSAGALVVAGLGWLGLPHAEGELGGALWLAALALAHGALGALALASRRTGHEIGLLLLGTCLTLANVAFGLAVDGPALAIGWAVSAALLAVLGRRFAGDCELLQLTLGGQLALASAHALLFDAPPDALTGEAGVAAGGVSALIAIAVAAFGCARVSLDDRRRWPLLLDGLALVLLAYVSALTLDGTALVIAWTAEALALASIARRSGDQIAWFGALGFLALAAAHALVVEAQPDEALLTGVGDVWAAALAIGAVAVGSLGLLRLAPPGRQPDPLVLQGLAAGAVVYLGSLAIVDAFQPGASVVATSLELGIRQQGQMCLSAFWSVCGFLALWIGLRGRLRPLRLAGFGLLSLAVAKVFLYDLSTLDSLYRVASFVGLGLLLLGAAFAYQRMRPAEAAPLPVDVQPPGGLR